jgi:amino acid adenylation domain-containing protein
MNPDPKAFQESPATDPTAAPPAPWALFESRPAVCLHQLFEARAAERPEAVAAVDSDGRSILYSELDARAGRLARELRRRGVGWDVPVGIHLEHGLDLLVAILGILKAGGAFVPLDRRQPAERLGHIASDAGLAGIVTRAALAEALRETGVPRVDLDEALAADGPDPADGPQAGQPPQSLAYILYTSGSTGRPKGVLTPHETLVNAYFAWEPAYELRTRNTVHAQIAAFSFAVFQADWIRALCSGGRLVLCPPEVLVDPEALADMLDREGVQFAEFVPAVLRPLMRHLRESGRRLPSMRTVVVGSDRWYLREHLEIPRAFGPAARAVHSFGLTETSIDTAFFLGSELDLSLDRMAPIGRPFANVRPYVLDGEARPAAPGETGQLVIGGHGVTRGLLNQPEWTAERFVPDPRSPEPGARCYLTGDLARVLADGQIEFLGRGDSQVKIRGFRVELGEIETALKSVDGIAEAVAAVLNGAEDPQLVAYLVPRGEARITAGALRRRLNAALPDYMMPSAFVLLGSLPLTSSGKIDRRLLPAPGPENLAPDDGRLLPRNATEGVIAALWAQMLGVEEIGVDESFFRLGGHSLLAARVVARTREAFGVALTVRDLFEAPTVAGFAERVERARAAGSLDGAPGLSPAGRDRKLPLAFSQQRLWFLEQMHPGNPAYTLGVETPVPAEADVPLLERVFEEIVRRHESLRTTFTIDDGLPVQRIGPPFRPRVEPLEWLPPWHVDPWLERERARPFDLEQGPLLRLALLPAGSGRRMLSILVHHIVSDAWSMGVLLHEMRVLLEAFGEGKPSPLPELPIQYADFAVWQRQALEGAEMERQLAYWRERLAGAPPLLDLPADRPRPAVENHRGATRYLLLPADLSSALPGRALDEDATPFMYLLAVFHTLLHRLSGAVDLPVGCAVANRPRPELEGLIGFFTNTLVLRGDLSGDPAFRELVARVREDALSAFAHQDLPFERLVEELRPERSLSHHPLFQVLFVLQNAPAAGPETPEPPEPPQRPVPGATKFDLLLQATETPHGLLAAWEYATDLFDDATVERFADCFTTLLRAAMEEPDRRVGSLRILSEAEERQLVEEWNETALPLPPEACIHEVFDGQAARRPGETALVWGEVEVSYGELRRRANALAEQLRRLGVGPEVRVGICCDRTPELVVALLAVLKAGGAYVPLDPAYPPARIGFMLRDSGVEVALVSERHRELVPPDGPRVVPLTPELEEAAETPETGVVPGNLAVIIYTSGSTGTPKGVALEHRGILTLLAWSRETFTEDEMAGVLASTSVCFDISIFEILLTLARGGRVILAENALHLPELPARDSVVVLNTVPSAMAELLEMGGVPKSVRVVNLAGEALSRSLVERVYRETRARRVHNLYGPSEETVYSTAEPVPAGEAREPAVGRPVAHTRVYVLDRQGSPVPVGALGEVYVAGAKLSRGYLARPALTAERYVPDPFQGDGRRMYRTGDIGRYLPDRRLEFVGRVDQQVKVRGFRVELGEIEAALRAHPGVRDAAVLARTDGGLGSRLVAYVEAAGEEVAAGALREHLRERLAAYMVPSQFVLLEALPRTPNGKIDRGRLPAPGAGAREREDDFVPARTETELRVARIWSDLLGVDEVGATDDFFELGGHSLLATRVLARVSEVCGVALSIRDVFEARTVRDLAARIDAQRGSGAPQWTYRPVRRVPRDRKLPLSHSQQRLLLFEQMHPGDPVYTLSTRIPLPPDVHRPALERALEELVRRHEILRTTFASEDGRSWQRVGPAFRPELETLGGGPLSADQMEELLSAELTRPFDLERGPLFRTVLARAAGGETLLIVTMHHIIADGWSVAILEREVAVLYDAFLRGAPSPLPDLEVQFADYAVWVRESLSAQTLEAQLAYWRERLAGAPALLELPADRPRPPAQVFLGATRVVRLSPELSDAVRELATREGVTVFMALLAAFAALLHRLGVGDDLPVGCPVANRPRRELEALIGYFANTLVLRADLAGGPSFRELLARVRDTALAAFARQDLPFERLVQELQPERSASYHPLFQVMFVLQNERVPTGRAAAVPPGPPPPIPEQPLRRFHKFDLTLNVADTPHGLVEAWEYVSSLFDDATVVRFAGHFGRLLEDGVREPGRAVDRLALLSEEERRQIIQDWNATARPEDPLLFHQRVAEVARLHPGAEALRFGAIALTYDDLDRRSNAFAHHLRAAGVGPEDRVGISCERSPGMVIAMLAVLKAGGAFVPLDPGYPRARLEHMVRDADCKVLLLGPGIGESLPTGGRPVLPLNPDAGAGPGDEALAASPPSAGLTPDHLAYMIYTSGTTGLPKGTMIAHRGLRNVALAQAEVFGLEPGDRVLQLASLSFDSCVFETVLALHAGAALVLDSRERSLPGPALEALLAEQAVDTLVITPSSLSAMDPRRVSPLRRLIVVGEAFPQGLAEAWAGRAGAVYNLYGPTEATIWATEARVDGSVRPPIGRPIANARVYALDRWLEPMPVGVAGELAIGGVGVSRGYLGQPGLTAEKFAPDPFGEPGSRLYRTGDLVRYRADGSLDYLGRADRQTKLRGYRIELSEIQSVLLQAPGVREAVVTVREDTPGQKRLVAYLVLEAGRELDVEGLKSHLEEHLPAYMVPVAFLRLAELPRTPSGKLDEAALPAPERALSRNDPEDLRPRTPIEEAVASIWEELLERPTVLRNENFFELGGHSLLAGRVFARLWETLGINLNLTSLFRSPVLADFAYEVQSALAVGGAAVPDRITPRPRTGPLPLSHAQLGLWFTDRASGGAPNNLSTMLQLPLTVDTELLRRALREVVRRHEILRTRYVEQEGAPLQMVEEAPPVEIEEIDLRHHGAAAVAEARRLAVAAGALPFDLGRAPLLRALLLRLPERHHLLCLVIHHIAADGWSLGILVRELSEAYEAFSRGEPARLPALPIQYGDYADWQRRRADAYAPHLAYWRQRLAGAPPLLELPFARPRPEHSERPGAMIAFTLPPELSQGVRDLARRLRMTSFMVLLGGFKALLHRATGATDLVVCTDVANRERRETEVLVGLFLNQVVLRTDLSGSPSYAELLERVRKGTLEAYAHQSLPFELLIRELQPERDLRYPPVAQIKLNLQNLPGGIRQGSGIEPPGEAAGKAPDPGGPETAPIAANLDLTVFLSDEDDGLHGTFVFNANLYDGESMRGLATEYGRILAEMAADPGAPCAGPSPSGPQSLEGAGA